MSADKQGSDDSVTEGGKAARPAVSPFDTGEKRTMKEPGKEPGKKPEKKSGTTSEKQQAKAAAKKSRLSLWLFLLLLLVSGIAGAMGYYGWQWQQQQLAAQGELRQDVDQLESLRDLPDEVREMVAQIKPAPPPAAITDNIASIDQWRENRQAISELAAQLQAQNRLLRSMSTTTRSDWLLAEAEYLLRLANQRLLMENSSTGALALLESADDILQSLDDMQLFAVREMLARDIAALRLVENKDRTGFYLRLSALAQQAIQLPVAARPMGEPTPTEVEPTPTEVEPPAQTDAGLAQKIRDNFLVAMNKLGDQVRIRRNDQTLEPLLPPDAENYLRQNIVFNIEQAQLALLRQETRIFRDSLLQAKAMLERYMPNQFDAGVITRELSELVDADIEVRLPDISGSLNALHDFNTRLHTMDADAGKPQLQPAASGEKPQP